MDVLMLRNDCTDGGGREFPEARSLPWGTHSRGRTTQEIKSRHDAGIDLIPFICTRSSVRFN